MPPLEAHTLICTPRTVQTLNYDVHSAAERGSLLSIGREAPARCTRREHQHIDLARHPPARADAVWAMSPPEQARQPGRQPTPPSCRILVGYHGRFAVIGGALARVLYRRQRQDVAAEQHGGQPRQRQDRRPLRRVHRLVGSGGEGRNLTIQLLECFRD